MLSALAATAALGQNAPRIPDTKASPSSPQTARPAALPPAPVSPIFLPAERAVSTWRAEAAAHLDMAPQTAIDSDKVARCVKLNNYWCIKKAGWSGEIAADGEGHVAFASALEGAAVAALLLKRYYVDFNRKTALAIISRWAPAQCGGIASGTRARVAGLKTLAPTGIRNTLRARWLATHARGFVTPVAGAGKAAAKPRRSVVTGPMPRLTPAPSIAVGLGEDRVARPITLDALLQNSPNAPRSRSMIGMPGTMSMPSITCAGDGGRIAAYAAKAASGIKTGPDDDLGLFDPVGAPTDNLATMMANMARVEIGPLAASPTLIKAGILEAFKPGRNP